VLGTHRVDGRAQQIIPVYLHRGPSETFYQDGTPHLGLAAYRMRRAEALQTHWGLVFVASSFVPLDCLPSLPTQGSVPITTMGEACRHQAQARMPAVIV
jgi:hypothetical protein